MYSSMQVVRLDRKPAQSQACTSNASAIGVVELCDRLLASPAQLGCLGFLLAVEFWVVQLVLPQDPLLPDGQVAGVHGRAVVVVRPARSDVLPSTVLQAKGCCQWRSWL